MARFGYSLVVPPQALSQSEDVVAAYAARLEALGGERWSAEDLDDPAPHIYLVATGGTERAVLDLQVEREASVPGEPVLLVTHPGNNSLPAALEVLARLQQDGARGRIVHVRGPEDEAGIASLEAALHDLRVRADLQSARIGMIGDPSDWLVASSPEPVLVTETWGPEIVLLGMDELRGAIREVSDADAASGSRELQADASGTLEPSEHDLIEAARVHRALHALVEEYRLDAVTVRCFDIVIERSTSGCFALSELTDAGVIAGCEGDIASTIGMLWAHRLTGETPWMANPADIDVATNALTLAHCTVPRTIVDNYRLRSHFESGLGVGIQGVLSLGPVTLLRVGGIGLGALWMAEGEIVSTGDAENLCRTQARVVLADSDVGDLLREPLGNHIVLIRGHHLDRLAEWWETML